MKKILKHIGIGSYLLLEAIIGFFIVYLMLFVGGGFISVGELKTGGDITLYVKTNGVHTDICLPVQSSIFDWKTIISVSDYPNETYSYISIGWGDKGFF